MTKGSKGNGLALTNELLQAMLGELGHIKGKLGELDAIRTELGAIKSELAEHRKILLDHSQTLLDHSVRLTNIEGSMRQVAAHVGQDRLEQYQRIQGLTQRVEVLERKVA